jgi:hypothetical protein
LDASAPSFRGLRSGSQKLTPIKAERSRRLWFAAADGARSPRRVVRRLADEARALCEPARSVADCALAVPSRRSAPSAALSLSTDSPAKSLTCSQISLMLRPFPLTGSAFLVKSMPSADQTFLPPLPRRALPPLLSSHDLRCREQNSGSSDESRACAAGRAAASVAGPRRSPASRRRLDALPRFPDDRSLRLRSPTLLLDSRASSAV